MARWAGSVDLISGSGRGSGRALARKLARDGARIVVNDLDEEPAAEVVRTIKEFGGDAVACVGNVTDADFGDRFVETAIKTFNGLDIIVSNAGYTLDRSEEHTSELQSLMRISYAVFCLKKKKKKTKTNHTTISNHM